MKGRITHLSCYVTGRPVPQGSMKAFARIDRSGLARSAVTSDNPSLRSWRHAVGYAVKQLRPPLSSDPVELGLVFYLPIPRRRPAIAHTRKPDLDKLIRAICDALSGIAYVDDRQIVTIRASKLYAADVQAGVQITLSYFETACTT